MSKYRTWREYLIKRLTSHPERAGGYLQAAFEEYQIHRDPAVFQLALQTVVESRGGITELSKKLKCLHKVYWRYSIVKSCPELRFSLLSSTHLGVRCRFNQRLWGRGDPVPMCSVKNWTHPT